MHARRHTTVESARGVQKRAASYLVLEPVRTHLCVLMRPASKQKEQLERMLTEQQTVKAKEAEAKSSAAAAPSRVSRARVPKPIVK